MKESKHIAQLLLEITKQKLPVKLFRRYVGMYTPIGCVKRCKTISGLRAVPNIQIGINGQADLYGFIFKNNNAFAVEIEVKSSAGDRLRPEQIKWRDFCLKNNIAWYESKDINKTIEWLQKKLQPSEIN